MENVENIFKKFFYTGVGFAYVAKEKFEDAIKDLIKDERISSEEGKKITEEFAKNMETKKEEFEKYMKEALEKTAGKLNLVSKAEVEELKKRIEELEKKLSGNV